MSLRCLLHGHQWIRERVRFGILWRCEWCLRTKEGLTAEPHGAGAAVERRLRKELKL